MFYPDEILSSFVEKLSCIFFGDSVHTLLYCVCICMINEKKYHIIDSM